MSFIQRIINALDAGIWKFIRVVHSANHDYPYHDFILLDNTEGEEDLIGHYVVGTDNVNAHGDQHKKFVSKRTVINVLGDPAEIKFNHADNVTVIPPVTFVDAVAGITFCIEEYHTNISEIFYSVPAGSRLLLYFEGVLPQEARDAE